MRFSISWPSMSFPLGSAKKDDKQKAEESYDMTTKKNMLEILDEKKI
jgi:hypothetical protein